MLFRSSSGPKSSRADIGIRFAKCMRANGVPNFSDPSGGGGGIKIPNGVNPQAPAFQAAQKTCFKLLPGGGPLSGKVSEARKEQLLKLARCMRAHGVSAFPDPTSGPPSKGPPTGGGIAFGSAGAFLSVPNSLMDSPAFTQAAATCGFPGHGKAPGL